MATVGADDKVLFKTVTIARDLGNEIELAGPAFRRTTASSSRRPTALPTAIQVRVVGAKGRPATVSERRTQGVGASEAAASVS